MSKKLLQINVTANWGSTGKIAEQIGLLAMEQGWESYIAYGRMMNPSMSNLIKIGTQWDVYLHYLLGRFFDMEGLASKRATKKLVNEIERIKPNIIHLHNIHDHYLNYPILFEYLASADIPVVWTQHDLWAITGGCCYIPKGCRKWKKGCHNCELRKGFVKDFSKKNYTLKKELFTAVKSLTIVPVSNWVSGLIKESYLGKCRVNVIHNGVDTELFKPRTGDIHSKYGLGEKKIVLGVASEWSERKGLGDFYKLAKLLPKVDFSIVIVGKILDGKEYEGTDGCRMVFIDRAQNALELAALYSAASVFVNPTYQDNYPTTNMEAIACGIPVITYRTGGRPESVDETTGMVVEQGDVKAVARAVAGFSNKKTSLLCRKKAESKFTSSTAFGTYIRLFDDLLGGKFLLLGVAHPWSERKGLKDYIALSKVLSENCVVMLVGLTGEQQRMLPGNMIGMGVTQNQGELAMLYNMASIVMNLSYSETFGLTTVEGLACGTPSIVYNATASPELVTPETGIVCKPGDIDAVADAVRTLLSKEKPIGACRKRAVENYDKSDRYQEYLDLYEELLIKK